MSVVIQRGYNTKIAYAEETTEGTEPSGTTITYTAFYANFEPRINRNLIVVEDAVGQRDVMAIDKGIKELDLSMTIYPTKIDLLQYAVASVDKSVAFWVKYEDLTIDHVYVGCKANELTLEGRTGEYLTASMTWYAKDLKTVAPSGPPTYGSLPTATPMRWLEEAVRIDNATVPEVVAFSVSVNNNFARVPQLGADTYRTHKELNREITAEITANFESTAHLTKLLNATEFTLEIDIGQDDGAVTRKVTLTGCKFRETSIPASRTDLIALRLPIIAKGITLA